MFADENEEIDENVQEDVLLPLASVCITLVYLITVFPHTVSALE
jgi:hypothetical protein